MGTRDVIWTEGLALSQQHLQQADYHRWQEMLGWRRYQAFNQFGFLHYDLNLGDLIFQKISLRSAQWVFPNGRFFQYDAKTDGALECILPLSKAKTMTVYLVLHDNNVVQGISGYPAHPAAAWVADYQTLQDSYDNKRASEVLLAKPSLMLQHEAPNPQTQSLAIARFDLEKIGRHLEEKTFIPSVMIGTASTALISLLKGLRDRAKLLHTKLSQQALTQQARLSQLHWLLILAQLQTDLTHYVTMPVAPTVIFQGLRQHLAALTHTAVDSQYDPKDLTLTFQTVCAQLTAALNKMPLPSVPTLTFKKNNDLLFVSEQFDPNWLSHHAFYLAVRFEKGATNWQQGFLEQIKIASNTQIDAVVTSSFAGIQMELLPSVPAGIIGEPDTYYFQLQLYGSAWEAVAQEGQLAIALTPTFVDIDFSVLVMPRR